jgi:hypothetical protein
MVTSAMPIWIEERDGTIVRGVAESVTRGGVFVRLPEAPRFVRGTGVALRLSLHPDWPTVAATARVSWVRGEDPAQCGLEWTSLEAPLEEWLSSRN